MLQKHNKAKDRPSQDPALIFLALAFAVAAALAVILPPPSNLLF